ncbi:MAG: sialidase family protein, partial [Acidimicrobiales bacterium]
PNCFWPDVAFDGDGRLLVLYTATGGRYNQPLGVWLQRYDGEQPAGSAVRVAGTEAFHARFAVDGRTVLVVYVQTPPENADRPLGFEPGAHPILLAISDDGGSTFFPPVAVSQSGERVAHPSVLVGAGGQVVVGALDYGDDIENYEATHEGRAGPPPAARWRVVVWRSTNGGFAFGPAVPVSDPYPVPQRVVIDLAPGPSFAADPVRNRLYASWDGLRGPNAENSVAGTGTGRDVFVGRSDDFGATWLAPTRLEPTAESQLLPAVGVAVAPDGRVDTVFYDRSRDPDDVMAEVVVGSSWDGGATFTTAVASHAAFDTRIGLGSPQGVPQLGNQLAVLSQADRFLAFWADTSQGTIDTNLQDLAVVTVGTSESGGSRWAVIVLGGLLVAAGAAVLIVSRRQARAQPEEP